MSDGWWNRNNRNSENPNTSGPGGIPCLVWIVILILVGYALYVAATSDDQRPGPLDPDSAPTPPAVIMPVNSWS
jgi:hypothetical protein